MAETLDTLATKIDALGVAIDKRFDQVDKRFDQIDTRFEQIDTRVQQVDRFDNLKTHLTIKIAAVDAKVDLLLERMDDFLKRDVIDMRIDANCGSPRSSAASAKRADRPTSHRTSCRRR